MIVYANPQATPVSKDLKLPSAPRERRTPWRARDIRSQAEEEPPDPDDFDERRADVQSFQMAVELCRGLA